jgi:hypothetical protein
MLARRANVVLFQFMQFSPKVTDVGRTRVAGTSATLGIGRQDNSSKLSKMGKTSEKTGD